MFKYDPENIPLATPDSVTGHFIITPFDLLELHVFTKKGEILIDPNNELIERNINNPEVYRPQIYYEVDRTGNVKLPMVEEVALSGMTLEEGESILQKAYANYYSEPFVKLNFINKRVVLLGAVGSKVIPLKNEKTRLTEILANADIPDMDAKMQNIRVLRGKELYVVDFSTVQGYLSSDMIVKSGDIIYVEPVKRPFSQFLRDNGPVISILTSIASLVAVLVSISN